MNGDITPLTENVVLTVENKIYAAVRVTPIPRFLPIPPRTFLLDNVTPSKVIMNAPSGPANREYHSVSNALTLPAPRSRSFSM